MFVVMFMIEVFNVRSMLSRTSLEGGHLKYLLKTRLDRIKPQGICYDSIKETMSIV
jgi:hypothetical protein